MPSSLEPGLRDRKQSQILAVSEIDICQTPINSSGSDAIVLVGSASAANSFLLSPRAIEYSFAHQPEPSQFADATKMIASQRRRAVPAPALPRRHAALGSGSRKTSFSLPRRASRARRSPRNCPCSNDLKICATFAPQSDSDPLPKKMSAI
jgi:hypothetical protein